ncbi:MAG: periplasmic heavy metal sensor [Acidobacteriota bacterium]
MSTRKQRFGFGVGIAAVIVALAGGVYIGNQHVDAQGPGGGPGGQGRFGPGGPGGPGGRGRGGPGGPGGAMGGPGMLGPLMLGRLDLTEAQRGQVKAILDSHKAEQEALGQRARAAHEALDAASSGDAFDEGLVRTRAAELSLVEADAAVARARAYNEVLQILTADQRSKIKTLQAGMKDRQSEMQKRRAERGARPQ